MHELVLHVEHGLPISQRPGQANRAQEVKGDNCFHETEFADVVIGSLLVEVVRPMLRSNGQMGGRNASLEDEKSSREHSERSQNKERYCHVEPE